MAWKTVLCDWNGTLLDDLPIVYESIKCIFKTYGVPAPPLAIYKEEITSEYMEFYWAHGIPKTVGSDDLNRIRKTCFEKCWNTSKLFPGAEEMLEHFKLHGIQNVLITAEDTEIMHHRATQFNLDLLFDIICADARDKAYAIRALKDYFNIEPTSCIYIDDNHDGLVMAKSLGVTTVGVVHGYHPPRRIAEAEPDFIAQNLNDVARIILAEQRVSA